MKAQNIRDMVALSARKAHVEAVRRIQTMLIQEMQSAGISHTLSDVWKKRLENAMNDLNVAIGEAEHILSESLFEDQFKYEGELDEQEKIKAKKDEQILEISYEHETESEITTVTRVGTKAVLKEHFNTVVAELYNAGTLNCSSLYHKADGRKYPIVVGFDEIQEFFDGE